MIELANELPTGKLVLLLRSLKAVKAQDLAREIGVDASVLSRIEKGWRKPDHELLEAIAAALLLSDYERTELLCSADISPTTAEVMTACEIVGPEIELLPYPVHLVDYRGFIWCWNAAWKSMYAPIPLPLDSRRVPRGVHWLRLLVDRKSRLRQLLEEAGRTEWEAVFRQQLAGIYWKVRRFLATDSREWPRWFTQLHHELSTLPAPDGEEFIATWEEIRTLEKNGDLPPPTAGFFMGELLVVGQAHQTYELVIQRFMTDARFELVRHELAPHTLPEIERYC